MRCKRLACRKVVSEIYVTRDYKHIRDHCGARTLQTRLSRPCASHATSTLHLRTVHAKGAQLSAVNSTKHSGQLREHVSTRRTRPSRARSIPTSPHAPRLSPQRPHERGGSDGATQVCASRAHASPCLSSRARLPGVRPAASRALTEPPALMRCWMHFTCPRAAAQ